MELITVRRLWIRNAELSAGTTEHLLAQIIRKYPDITFEQIQEEIGAETIHKRRPIDDINEIPWQEILWSPVTYPIIYYIYFRDEPIWLVPEKETQILYRQYIR